MEISRKLSGLDTFEQKCRRLLENVEDTICQRMKENNEFIIYGAGKAGKYTIRYLRKYFSDIHILCVAVSEEKENVKSLEKIPVKPIDQLKSNCRKATVITAVTIQQYQDEMNEILLRNGFRNVINLLEEIRE